MSSLSYEALCLPLRQDLLGLARRYTQNGADDLVQDTFIKAYLSWDLFKQETDNLARDVKVWLRRILTNTYYTQWKREQRRAEISEEDLDNTAKRDNTTTEINTIKYSAMDEVTQPDYILEVRSVVDSLPEMYQDIITRHYFQGQTYDEIMHELNIPLTQVQKRLWRGRQYIKKALGRAVDTSSLEPTKLPKSKSRRVKRVMRNDNLTTL